MAILIGLLQLLMHLLNLCGIDLVEERDDYCIESSIDGINYSQMRIFHMWKGNGTIQFGIYACSPENSSFKAIFTNMEITDCKWLAHDGQASDGNV